MADHEIDQRLFASASSVQPSRPQIYTSAQQQNTGHPYYLPSPTAQHHAQSLPQPPQLSQLSQPAPLGNILDPALEQTSPTGPEASHDDDDHEDDGDHDGYVVEAQPAPSRQLARCVAKRRLHASMAATGAIRVQTS